MLLMSLPVSAQDDGCALLTRQEVEAAAGTKMNRKRPVDRTLLGVVSTGCTYNANDWRVVVRIERGRDLSTARSYMRMLRGVVKQTTASDARAVRGLGDEAWWGPISPTDGILSVRRGSDIIWVETQGKGGRGFGTLETTRPLTQKVLARYAAGRNR
jgi:hypothetical protein